MSVSSADVTAVILAGGRGRRMGGMDKGLIEFNGRSIIEVLLARLKHQTSRILINANRNIERYRAYGYPVVSDILHDFQGPLAGFASAMNAVDSDFILTLPCDGPCLPDDYLARFISIHNAKGAPICVAHDGERLQPVHALIKTDLLDSLGAFLERGDRKIDHWYAGHDFEKVDFSDKAKMFCNINTPGDQQQMQDKF